jgi:hypothetical protein
MKKSSRPNKPALCECKFAIVTEDNGLCLHCSTLTDFADQMGLSKEEYASVPIRKRPAFLSDQLEKAIISGQSPVNPAWVREVWDMLDSIKMHRVGFGLPTAMLAPMLHRRLS